MQWVIIVRMSSPEEARADDPILEDPDGYFLEHYGDVEVSYKGSSKKTLSKALEFEHLYRTPEEIASDPKTRRANVFIGMLRETGALREEDDRTYPEEEQ